MNTCTNITVAYITEEVMLAEENKSSGRSPLDGTFTRLRTIQYMRLL